MKRKSIISVALILALILTMGLVSCTPYDKRPKISINTANALEDQYLIIETEYDIATHGEGAVLKPTASQFRNVSRQKTLNARLNTFNEAVAYNEEAQRNEQIYREYEVLQKSVYMVSIRYNTSFTTTLTDRGVNMIIGSEINGTLMMNFPALLGTNIESDEWVNFFYYFNEQRALQGAKEITIEYMTTDAVSFCFEGEDQTNLTLCILYKVEGDTEQQEVRVPLNDVVTNFTETMQVYFTFIEDAEITYEQYAQTITEYTQALADEE
jgi:hypothetical protein